MLYLTAPFPVPAGSLTGTIEVVEKYEYSEKTDTIIHKLVQMLRGNFNESFGYSRFFTFLLRSAFRDCDNKQISPIFRVAVIGYMAYAFWGLSASHSVTVHVVHDRHYRVLCPSGSNK